jgi:hypothetical protein
MQRKAIRALGMVVALFIGTALPGLCGTAPPQRVNAHTLVRIAADSCAGAVKALDAPGFHDPRYQPLRAALEGMSSLIADVGARLNTRDLGFFRALRGGTKTLAEVRTVLARTGLHDPQVERDIQSLDDAYSRLRNRYGDEWLRFRTGKPVNEEEKRRFEAMRAAQAALAGKLAVLQQKARTSGNAATAQELALLITQADSIAAAPATLDEILNASVLNDTIQGEYAATRDANPADDPEWNDADQAVDNLETDAGVGFVFTTDLQSVQQWSYVDEPAEPAPAVQAVSVEPEPAVEPEPGMEMEPEPEAAESELTEPGEPEDAEGDTVAEPETPSGDVQILELPPDDEAPSVSPQPAAPSPPAPAPATPAPPPQPPPTQGLKPGLR